jgi:hypothetical protein
MIPGSSTINFDEITKKNISIYWFCKHAIVLWFEKGLQPLKFKLGRIPMMMDFIEHGSRDPYLYVNYSNSYYNSLSKWARIRFGIICRTVFKFFSNNSKVEEKFNCQTINWK